MYATLISIKVPKSDQSNWNYKVHFTKEIQSLKLVSFEPFELEHGYIPLLKVLMCGINVLVSSMAAFLGAQA